MDIPDFLKPNSKLAPPGTDPLAMPTHRSRGPNKLLIGLLGLLMVGFICAGGWGLFRNATGGAAAAPATVTEAGGGNLPAPGVQIQEATATLTPTATKITAGGLMTQFAASEMPSPTTDPCDGAPGHFLTQLACDDRAMTATLAAAQPGQVVNVSGVDSRVTTVYIYPTSPPTPWVITASPTWTPIVIVQTVEIPRIVTATPGPTQTPWFYITQPPVVTVVMYQTVELYYTQEVTREVTVVVTATASETPTPTETPTP